MPTARLCALLSAFILSLALAPTPVIAQSGPKGLPETGSSEPDSLHVQFEAGPAVSHFIGGGFALQSSQSGTGFCSAISVLHTQSEDGVRIGGRLGYEAFFYKDIGGFHGQELREHLITVGGQAEYPFNDYLSVQGHVDLGWLIARADYRDFFFGILPYDETAGIFALGGGLRIYPIRHIYVSGEAAVHTVLNPDSDVVHVNLRAAVLLGGSF